ncbi:MAG: hypothetical protein HY048_08375 [Acidobacteria bacterium]|nr:hypothetical protein [Acidobacteriota bacterium]
MWTDAGRRRVAALRQPARAARIARGLWIAWALVVWNLVFDHSIITAGRAYVGAAVHAAASGDSAVPAPRMDDWMRPAVTRGLWTATAAGGAVLATGLWSVRRAARAASSGLSPASSRQDR